METTPSRRDRKRAEPRQEPLAGELPSGDEAASEGVGWSDHPAWRWLAVTAFGVVLALLAADLGGVAGGWLYTSAAATVALVSALFGLRGYLKEVPGPSFALLVLVGLGVSVVLFAALSAAHEPSYPQMNAQFNVAVSGFTDASGGGSNAEVAERLADEVADELAKELRLTAGGVPVSIAIARPADVPPVTGATPDQRATNAGRASDRVGAQVVLYGTLDVEGVRTIATPHIFIAAGPHLPGASELEGQHVLGEPIETRGDILGLANFGRVRSALAARVSVLADVIAGLADYHTQEIESFETARDRFAGAVASGALGEGRGSEVAHLFLGNAELQLGNLDAAEAAYEEARRANSDSGRAPLGLAGTQYARAAGADCLDADIPGLHDALRVYGAAHEATDQPLSALVVPKARLGMGRTYNCLAIAGEDGNREAAIEMLGGVAGEYDQSEGQEDLQHRELAALAHAELAVAHRSSPASSSGLSLAAESYERAVDLTLLEDRRARWLGDLADTYALAGRCVEATAAHEAAVEAEPALSERLGSVRQRCPSP